MQIIEIFTPILIKWNFTNAHWQRSYPDSSKMVLLISKKFAPHYIYIYIYIYIYVSRNRITSTATDDTPSSKNLLEHAMVVLSPGTKRGVCHDSLVAQVCCHWVVIVVVHARLATETKILRKFIVLACMNSRTFEDNFIQDYGRIWYLAIIH